MAQPQFEFGIDGPKVTFPLTKERPATIEERIKQIRAELDLVAAVGRDSQVNIFEAEVLVPRQVDAIAAAYQNEADRLQALHQCRVQELLDRINAQIEE